MTRIDCEICGDVAEFHVSCRDIDGYADLDGTMWICRQCFKESISNDAIVAKDEDEDTVPVGSLLIGTFCSIPQDGECTGCRAQIWTVTNKLPYSVLVQAWDVLDPKTHTGEIRSLEPDTPVTKLQRCELCEHNPADHPVPASSLPGGGSSSEYMNICDPCFDAVHDVGGIDA